MNVDENCLLKRGLSPFTMDFWEEEGLLIYKMIDPSTPVDDIMTKIVDLCDVPRDNCFMVFFNDYFLVIIEIEDNSFTKFIHQFRLPYCKWIQEGRINAVAPPGSQSNMILQQYNIMQFELPNWSNKGLLFYHIGKTKGLSFGELKQKAVIILNVMQIPQDKVDSIKIITLRGVHVVVQEIELGAFAEFQKVHNSQPFTLVPATDRPPSNKTCPVCGKQNNSGAKFCGKCGIQLEL